MFFGRVTQHGDTHSPVPRASVANTSTRRNRRSLARRSLSLLTIASLALAPQVVSATAPTNSSDTTASAVSNALVPQAQAQALPGIPPLPTFRILTPQQIVAWAMSIIFPGHNRLGGFFPSPEIPARARELEAQGISLIGPGTPVIVGQQICTIGAAGYDSAGRKVAITAGHCGVPGAPVVSMDSARAGLAGHMVRLDGGDPSFGLIELGPNTQVTRSYGAVTINHLGGTVPRNTGVCKNGVATGWTCGKVLETFPTETFVHLCANHGDSGGPVVSGDRLISIIDRGTVGTLLPCIHPLQGAVHTPVMSENIDAIVANLNSTPGVGQGFRLP